MRMNWMSMGWALALSAAAASGCAEDKLVRFADLRDGDFIGGAQVTEIETDFTLRVVGAELYVDGQLATAAPFAPFQLVWDTRGFDEKQHRLTLRVRLDGGDSVEDTIRVTIDNTAPVIGELGANQVASTNVSIPVEDNFAVERVEVESSLSPGKIAVGSGPRPSITWPAGCGPSRAKVIAFDKAGNSAERTFNVVAADQMDFDCDGFRATYAGGEDCDDSRNWVFPGAPEIVEGFDFSCDGQTARRDGEDFDGDGVLSIADGGDDCDDADPLVHGGLARYAQQRLSRDGAAITWEPGEAVTYFSSLILNRAGVIEKIEPRLGADSRVTPLATGANPRSLAIANQVVAFGRGNDVVLIDAVSGEQRNALTTAGPVGKLSLNLSADAGGLSHVVTFQSGTKVWVASVPDEGAGPWKQRFIADVAAPLVVPPTGMLDADSAWANLVTANKMWKVRVDKNNVASEEVVDPLSNVTAVSSDSYDFYVGRSNASGGGVLQIWHGGSKSNDELSFPSQILDIYPHSLGLLVQLSNGKAVVVRRLPYLRMTQVLQNFVVIRAAGTYSFTTAELVNGTSQSWMHSESGSIPPARRGDDREKNRDSDCDGYRY